MNPFGVEAAIAAYNESEYWIEQLCEYLQGNYNYLKGYMAEHLPKVPVTELEGTYLVWADISRLGLTSDAATSLLLSEGKVLVNSGTMYGAESGEGFIRINIACPRSQLEEALARICNTLKGQKGRPS